MSEAEAYWEQPEHKAACCNFFPHCMHAREITRAAVLGIVIQDEAKIDGIAELCGYNQKRDRKIVLTDLDGRAYWACYRKSEIGRGVVRGLHVGLCETAVDAKKFLDGDESRVARVGPSDQSPR